MTEEPKKDQAGLSRATILKAFEEISGEKVPVKAQYLVEGLFEEGKV